MKKWRPRCFGYRHACLVPQRTRPNWSLTIVRSRRLSRTPLFRRECRHVAYPRFQRRDIRRGRGCRRAREAVGAAAGAGLRGDQLCRRRGAAVAGQNQRHRPASSWRCGASGKSGLDILRKLRAAENPAPIFVTSGEGDIPMAVDAIRSGASDFIEKPFCGTEIVGRVKSGDRQRCRASSIAPTVASKMASLHIPGREPLSRREREVLAQMADGATNKETARQLGPERANRRGLSGQHHEKDWCQERGRTAPPRARRYQRPLRRCPRSVIAGHDIFSRAIRRGLAVRRASRETSIEPVPCRCVSSPAVMRFLASPSMRRRGEKPCE